MRTTSATRHVAKRWRRSSLSLPVLGVLFAGVLSLGIVSSAAALETRAGHTYWEAPAPWGASPTANLRFAPVTVRGTTRAFDIADGANSLYQFRSFTWKGWGSSVATGTGRSRYCNGSCGPYRATTLTLSRPVKNDGFYACGDDPAKAPYYFYSRFRAKGVLYDSGGLHNSRRVC